MWRGQQTEREEQMAEHQQNCCRISGCAAVYPQFRKLAVERRPADSQAARHFGHAAAIVADGEADDVRLYVRERANVAVGLIKHDSNAFVRKLRIGRLVFAHRNSMRRDLREIRRRESVPLAQYSRAKKGVLKLADRSEERRVGKEGVST